jgi:hypothetical protein
MRPRLPIHLDRKLTCLLLCGAIFGGCGSESRSDPPPPSLGAAKSFDRFPVYFAGGDVDGLPLTSVSEASHGRFGTEVTFSYGDCDPPDGLFAEGGCSLPLSIQNWSTCVRWGKQLHDPLRAFDLRGAKATNGGGGSQLEVFTGTTTVVIWAHERRVAESAARQLQDVRPADRFSQLPPPIDGSLQGKLPCQGKPG